MPARRTQDGRFQKINTWRFVALLIVFGAAGFACPWGSLGWRIVGAGLGMFVGYKLANIWEWLAIRRYRCPRCRAKLGTDMEHWQEGRDVVLYCEACDVAWDTGVKSRSSTDENGNRPSSWD